MTTIKRGDIKDLKFREEKAKDWELPEAPTFGTVGTFTADGIEHHWNRFIVVKDNGDKLAAIFPQMLLIGGEIVLGRDKISDPDPGIYCDYCKWDNKGAWYRKHNNKEGECSCFCGRFKTQFERVLDDYEYEIIEFEKPKRDGTYLEFVCKSQCNDDWANYLGVPPGLHNKK